MSGYLNSIKKKLKIIKGLEMKLLNNCKKKSCFGN